MSERKSGLVYLVGSGPGDPDLMTLAGKRAIERADVLVYDYLANPIFLSWVRADCEKIYVGKKGGSKTNISQEEISAIIVEKAKAGRIVTRLKGGDPMVFGRGGEEAQELAAAGIRFEIIPGITSGIAGPAYAGIPVTHREHCSQVTLLTGHDAAGREETQVTWDRLAEGTGTIIVYMGVKKLRENAAALIRGGRPGDTPCALIQWGTYPRQRTLVSTLDAIADTAEAQGFGAPCIFVCGTVVSLREQLNWFESRPLFGKSVLVTRARAQASQVQQDLLDLGAEPVPFPTIEIHEPESWAIADTAIGGLSAYDWVIFTSTNGVDRFFSRLRKQGGDVRDLHGARVAAIGSATAAALEERGLRVDVVPREFDAEGLVEHFRGEEMKGKKVLIPRAAEAREVLPDSLREMGAEVTVAPVYRSVLPGEGGEEIRERIVAGNLDLITFASSSTVKNFFELVGRELAPTINRNCAVACIGPITAETAKEFGLEVHIQPAEYTIPALIDAVMAWYADRP